MKTLILALVALFSVAAFAGDDVDTSGTNVNNKQYLEMLPVDVQCWYFNKDTNMWGQGTCNTLTEFSCLGQQAAILRKTLKQHSAFILNYGIQSIKIIVGDPPNKQVKTFNVTGDPVLTVEVPFKLGTNRCDVLTAAQIEHAIMQIRRRDR